MRDHRLVRVRVRLCACVAFTTRAFFIHFSFPKFSFPSQFGLFLNIALAGAVLGYVYFLKQTLTGMYVGTAACVFML